MDSTKTSRYAIRATEAEQRFKAAATDEQGKHLFWLGYWPAQRSMEAGTGFTVGECETMLFDLGTIPYETPRGWPATEFFSGRGISRPFRRIGGRRKGPGPRPVSRSSMTRGMRKRWTKIPIPQGGHTPPRKIPQRHDPYYESGCRFNRYPDFCLRAI